MRLQLILLLMISFSFSFVIDYENNLAYVDNAKGNVTIKPFDYQYYGHVGDMEYNVEICAKDDPVEVYAFCGVFDDPISNKWAGRYRTQEVCYNANETEYCENQTQYVSLKQFGTAFMQDGKYHYCFNKTATIEANSCKNLDYGFKPSESEGKWDYYIESEYGQLYIDPTWTSNTTYPYYIDSDNYIWIKNNLDDTEDTQFYIYTGGSTDKSNGTDTFTWFRDVTNYDSNWTNSTSNIVSMSNDGGVINISIGGASTSSIHGYYTMPDYNFVNQPLQSFFKVSTEYSSGSNGGQLYVTNSFSFLDTSRGVLIQMISNPWNNGNTTVYSGNNYNIGIPSTDPNNMNLIVNRINSTHTNSFNYNSSFDLLGSKLTTTPNSTTITFQKLAFYDGTSAGNYPNEIYFDYIAFSPTLTNLSNLSYSCGSEDSGSWIIDGETYTGRINCTVSASEDINNYAIPILYSDVGGSEILVTNETMESEFDISTCKTITSPGYYNLTTDLTSSLTQCIQIDTDNVTIDGKGYSITGNQSTDTYAIQTWSASGNILIKNLEVSQYKHGIYVHENNNVTIQNVTTHSNYDSGIYAYQLSNLTVDNVTSYNNSYFGIVVDQSNDSVVMDSTIYNQSDTSLYYKTSFYGNATNNLIYDAQYAITANLNSSFFNYDGNEFYDIVTYGIYISENSSGFNITDNTGYQVDDTAIYTFKSEENKVEDNTIYSNYVGIGIDTCSNNTIVKDNLVYNNDYYGIWVGANSSICPNSGVNVTGNTITNSNNSILSWNSINTYLADNTLTENIIISNTTVELGSDQGGFTDNGYEIKANNINVNCNGYTINSNNGDSAFYTNAYDNITIHDCIIEDFKNGIFTEYETDDITIYDNVITTSELGIRLSSDSLTGLNITGNTIYSTSTTDDHYCIALIDLEDTTEAAHIEDNTLIDCYGGIRLHNGNYTLVNNYIYGNRQKLLSIDDVSYVNITNLTLGNSAVSGKILIPAWEQDVTGNWAVFDITSNIKLDPYFVSVDTDDITDFADIPVYITIDSYSCDSYYDVFRSDSYYATWSEIANNGEYYSSPTCESTFYASDGFSSYIWYSNYSAVIEINASTSLENAICNFTTTYTGNDPVNLTWFVNNTEVKQTTYTIAGNYQETLSFTEFNNGDVVKCNLSHLSGNISDSAIISDVLPNDKPFVIGYSPSNMTMDGMENYMIQFYEDYAGYIISIFSFGISFLITRRIPLTLLGGGVGLIAGFFFSWNPLFLAGGALCFVLAWLTKQVMG